MSRSHTFTMAGQNFDRAVGGLNLVFFDLKLRGRLAGVRTRRWCNLWRKSENILYTPFKDESVICIIPSRYALLCCAWGIY